MCAYTKVDAPCLPHRQSHAHTHTNSTSSQRRLAKWRKWERKDTMITGDIFEEAGNRDKTESRNDTNRNKNKQKCCEDKSVPQQSRSRKVRLSLSLFRKHIRPPQPAPSEKRCDSPMERLGYFIQQSNITISSTNVVCTNFKPNLS